MGMHSEVRLAGFQGGHKGCKGNWSAVIVTFWPCVYVLCPKELSEAKLNHDGLICLVGEISRHPGCGMAIAHFLQLGFK